MAKRNISILHIVGNRPQFIKLAPVFRAVENRGYKQMIVHSGQHFDSNMSEIFFEELDIPRPDKNLQVHTNGGHAEMTARMMLALEPVISAYRPDIVVVYGDTNTTLAAALTAKKLCIPIIHVEAGSRTGKEYNPEEINRVVVDRISDLLCTPDRESYDNLVQEHLENKAFFSGDVMYDTFLSNKQRVNSENLLMEYSLEKNKYILMTWHRQENTSDKGKMTDIIELLEQIRYKIILPLHPRTKKKLQEFELWDRINKVSNLCITEPVGYLEMIGLLSNCAMTLTDSGGVSKESFFAGVKSLFMVDLRVWPDLENSGWIRHLSQNINENIEFIDSIFQQEKIEIEMPMFYGDGKAAEKIVAEIEKRFNTGE